MSVPSVSACMQPESDMTAIPKVAFVLFQNARAGTGTEVAVLNYIRFSPLELRESIYLIQGDSFDAARAEVGDLEQLLPAGHVITVPGTPKSSRYQFVSSVPALSLLFYGLLHPIWIFIGGIGKRYRRAVRSISPNIVYLVGNDISRYCKFPLTRVIGSCHGWNPRSAKGISGKIQLGLLRAGLLYRSVDSFHTFPGSDIPKNLPPHKSWFCASNGVDPAIFHPPQSTVRGMNEGDGLRFLFVGRLEACKGVLTAVKAWQRLKRQGCDSTLEIVGGGPLSRWLKHRKIQGLTFSGLLSLPELAERYRYADIFLYPSTCDVFPFVILEALSSGLHVLASDYLRGTFDRFESEGYLEYCSPTVDALQERMKEISQRSAHYSASRLKCAELAHTVFGARETTNQFFRGLGYEFPSTTPAL